MLAEGEIFAEGWTDADGWIPTWRSGGFGAKRSAIEAKVAEGLSTRMQMHPVLAMVAASGAGMRMTEALEFRSWSMYRGLEKKERSPLVASSSEAKPWIKDSFEWSRSSEIAGIVRPPVRTRS